MAEHIFETLDLPDCKVVVFDWSSNRQDRFENLVCFNGDGSLSVTEPYTNILSDANNNSVTLGADGITLRRGSSEIAIGDAEVNVNQGALEIM
jgi:hypothetical protein